MIYTIGYARLAPARLLEIATALDAQVVDVRRSPRSRIAGYGARQLPALLGSRYVWAGDTLGGGQVTEAGLALVEGLARTSPVILMCLEHSPGDCHRHHDIALPLARRGWAVRHIYEWAEDDGSYAGELVEPLELQRAIDQGDAYVSAAFDVVRAGRERGAIAPRGSCTTG